MTIFEKVRATLAKQLEIDPELINEDTNIVEDLGVDSLDIVELIMELEETYNIVITNDEAGDLSTVGKIAKFIESKL